MEKLKGKLTMSRPIMGNDDEFISIQVKDSKSNLKFLEVQISYENFALCVTGRGEVNCDLVVKDLESVGKVMETKILEFIIPEEIRYKRQAIKKLAEKHVPEGWNCDYYFGAKSSFYKENGQNYAKVNIYRFVKRIK